MTILWSVSVLARKGPRGYSGGEADDNGNLTQDPERLYLIAPIHLCLQDTISNLHIAISYMYYG